MWRMVESNSTELNTVSKKLLKDNEKTPDQLFIRNMAVPPAYNVDANVQGLSQIILHGPYVDAKLHITIYIYYPIPESYDAMGGNCM